MNFIPIAIPQTESELVVALSLLDAHGIQYYVHNQGFGGLYPGTQVDLYNDRRIMVRTDQASDARDLLHVLLRQPIDDDADVQLTMQDKMRVLIEACIFGWFIPRKRKNRNEDSGD